MAATVAVSTTVPVLLPLIWAALTPPVTVPSTARVAPGVASVSRTLAPSASTSDTASPDRVRFVSSVVVTVAGTVLIGASLIGLMVIGTMSVSVSGPPVPLLPRSSVVMVSTSAPLKSCAER